MDGSFSRFFWRATLPFQHIQTTASEINFRCQHVLNSIIMNVEIFSGGERLREEVEGSKQNFPCAVVGC